MKKVADAVSSPRDPFHVGERALQQLTGAREQIAEVGARIVRDFMPEQHRELFAKLPFVVIGSVGAEGYPQASVLAGPPGFVHSPDPRTLAFTAWPQPADPLKQALQPGAALGVLGIEPHTRRRNRANGDVVRVDDAGFALRVQQSFGNCPKYIQARRAQWIAPDEAARAQLALRREGLDDEAAQLISSADTFYIASSYPLERAEGDPAHGVDVSHRGGKPGFVRVDRDARGAATLTVPDFSGNFMFNTLGNLLVNPRAGLLFIDFERGDLLQLQADAELVIDGEELASFEGADRLLRLRVRTMLRRPAALSLRWSRAELSPFVLETGQWK